MCRIPLKSKATGSDRFGCYNGNGLAAGILIWLAIVCLFSTTSQAIASPDLKQLLPVKEQSIRVHNNLLSLDIANADIRDVLQEIAGKAKIGLALGEGVAGKISIKLTEVTFEEALKQLCQSSALVYEYLPDKKTYRIIHAAGFAKSGENGGRKTASSAGQGSELKETPSPALANKAKAKPGLLETQGNSGSVSGPQERPRYKSGEILVRFRQGTTADQIGALHQALGSTVIGSISNLRLQRVRLREKMPEDEGLTLYKGAAIVESAEKHALRYTLNTPNDPDLSQQWGITKIKAREAWDITQGNKDIVVAVIDTGMDFRHPDLKDNIWTNAAEAAGLSGVDDDKNGYIDDVGGWDFAGSIAGNPQTDADPMDFDGHGTHVAGIIAARGNNTTGIAGINWRIKIMPLKVQADNDNSLLSFAIIEAIQYAIQNGAKIVNCSFGGSGYSNEEKNAFMDLQRAGILAVCAAGNYTANTDIAGGETYPAAYDLDNIISVAASDQNDKLATFSNYGLTSVDVMAPGVGIYSTVKEGTATLAQIKTEGANPIVYPAIGMLFAGVTDGNGITGVAYDCGKGYPEQFPAGVSGNIALMRGSRDLTLFRFYEKVRNAQNAGAAGVIVYNNVVDLFDTNGGTLGSSGDWVPVVSVSMANGAAFKALGTPVVTVINKLTVNPYGLKSGTSMAAPHVTGIAGLLLSYCPAVSYTDIKSAIFNTVDKIPAVAGKMVTGGRVNAFAALKSILLSGDLSGDCRIGLDDAVIALQIISRQESGIPCPACVKDVNGDDKIGLPEAIYILQKAADLR